MRRLPITAQIIEGHRWAELSMSQHTDCYELVRLAFKERQVDGTEPFVQEFQFLDDSNQKSCFQLVL